MKMRDLIKIVEAAGDAYETRRQALERKWARRRDAGGTITLYRVIGVKEEWSSKLQPGADLGAHWAARSDMHIHEFPVNEVILFIKVEAPTSAIVVEDTVGYQLTYPEEAEVCLRRGTAVKLVSIHFLDSSQRNGLAYRKIRQVRRDLNGQTFYAGSEPRSEPVSLVTPEMVRAFWATHSK